MPTHIQWSPNIVDWYQIGTSGGGTKYTLVADQTVVYIGVDGDGNANRVISVNDVSEHHGDGIARTSTADTAYTKGMVAVMLWPLRILTANVNAALPPVATADNRVYLLDAGTWSRTDGSSGLHSYGTCTQVITSGEYSGLYELNLDGPDWPA